MSQEQLILARDLNGAIQSDPDAVVLPIHPHDVLELNIVTAECCTYDIEAVVSSCALRTCTVFGQDRIMGYAPRAVTWGRGSSSSPMRC